MEMVKEREGERKRKKEKYAYFLGCITPNRYPGIEAATKRILSEFGIETIEMKGASCCPAPGVVGSFDLNTWLSVAARNICIAEESGCDIYVTCNGCYGTLQEANHLLKHNEKLRKKVNESLSHINKEYKGSVEVKHVIEIFYDDIGWDVIKKDVQNPLEGLKVAVHYGCHFLKPSEIRGHGSSERPRILDELIEATGASSITYKDKLMCCGAGGGVRTRDLNASLKFTLQKVEDAKEAGADCIVHPCAFCHLQLDRGQREIKDIFDNSYNFPILFYSQLLGIAMGLNEKELGLEAQYTKFKIID